MKRVLVSAAILLAIGAFVVIAGGASNSDSAAGTYKIQVDNAFGLVSGADFKVAGVRAGKIQSIDLPKECIDGGGNPTCHALVTVQVTQNGFGSFKSDAFCQSRPQSLIGEYFIECQPGQYGKTLKPGSTIPVSHTESTIPADLVQNVMRLPYRQRFTLIVNELGAAVAGRSGDLQSALRRAVPALTETDNLLNLLANDSHTLQQLTGDSNSVITALANNSKQVNRFIVEAGNTARDTAAQDSNLRLSLQRLPGLLEQLRPAMAKLGTAADANEPVLANLNSAAKNFNTLLRDLPAFSQSALPAVRSLGKASATGKVAVEAATPTIAHLNQFAKPTPELAQNLSIVLHDLDNRSRAVEPDPRSPGGKGFTGLEALLQYAFIQPLAINTFGPLGHMLAVDAFVSPTCSPYATPSTIASTIKSQGVAAARSCYSMLGPDQPGVTTTDPTNPSACVPDPGGAPPGEKGAPTTACKLQASAAAASPRNAATAGSGSNTASSGSATAANTSSSPPSGRGGGSPTSPTSNPASSVQSTLGQISAALGGTQSSGGTSTPSSSGGQTPAAPQLPPGPMRSRAQQSAFANPVLIGAVTVLILLIAVFLAYNANTGLPFVPTRELKVDIANGSNLVVGNEVRSGGFRIGVISEMKPIALSNGQTGAQLTLNLDQAHGKVPVDSSATIQPASVLGTKYLDLHTGTSSKVISDGGLLPLGQTRVPVQFDDVFKTFDSKTRIAVQDSLAGAGDALTARGSALNDTISSLPPLLLHLQPVAKYLSAPSTNLTGFLGNLERFMGAVAPVARVNADLFTQMATTFAAIDSDPGNLQATIAKSPSTEAVSTESLKVQQPFLVDLTTFGRAMTPATASLNDALPAFVPAIEAGTQTLKRTPSLNANLQQVMDALKGLARAPGTNIALNGLVSTVNTLNPVVRYLGPYQTVCDDWNYWWTYLSEHLSEQTAFGFAQRALLNQANAAQPNNVGSQGATAPVNGGGADSPTTGGNEFLHAQPYGAAVDNQGNADCETGQRGYPKKLNNFDPQGRNLAVDPHTPGVQGPTFNGGARVPAGETFSRNPPTGPQLPANPSNP